MAIRDYRDRRTADFVSGRRVRQFHGFADAVRRALARLDAATRLVELYRSPGARLEALRGERAGEWSIRINDQWRLCFRWELLEAGDQLTARGEPHDVEIVDYH